MPPKKIIQTCDIVLYEKINVTNLQKLIGAKQLNTGCGISIYKNNM